MKRRTSWSTTIECPFCGNLIVEAFDFVKIPDDLSDEDEEEYTCGDAGIDWVEGRCEHLAALSKYYDGWASVQERWLPHLVNLVNLILHDSESGEVTNVSEVESALEYMDFEEVEILKYTGQIFDGAELRVAKIYVEKMDGVKGGGPNYCALFFND